MQKLSFSVNNQLTHVTHLSNTRYLGGLLLIVLLLLNVACGQAQVPSVTFSEPLVITKGGTYSGNYKSTSSTVPAIAVQTTEPVILQNCTLVGPGDLIYADRTGTDLTVRECRGYGTTPTIDNRQKGVFLYMLRGKNLVMEHNYLEQNQGVTLDRWVGDGSSNQTIRMRYNQVLNLDARTRNGSTNSGCFALVNNVRNLANVDISWNQVISLPNKSAAGDLLNLYESSGTESSPIRMHDNYLQGSYPVVATSGDFSGSGFTTDGDGNTATTCTRFFRLDHNQFVGNCNGAINLPVGRNGEIDHNRVVMSALLADGTKLLAVYAGIHPSNFYRKLPREAFGDFSIHDNVVGYVSHGPVYPFPNRYDIADRDAAFNQQFNITFGNNTSLPNPITYQTEQNELVLWQQKLKDNNVTPGLSGGTATTPNPTESKPAPAPPTTNAPAPTAPTNATFYRAFNLNGSGLTLDGNKWEANSAPGLQVTGGTSFVGQNTLNPVTDATRTGLILSSIYGERVTASVSNVPNASYLVFLYVWEDNDAETFNILVNGKVAQANYNSGAAGHWDRLGPYPATVTNGVLTVGTSGGTANLSGLELWTAGGTSAPTTPAPPTPAPTANAFYRAFDLNGGATTIEGNKWEAGSAVQVANGTNFVGTSPALSPATDAARANMLRSSVYGTRVQLTVPSLPNASYAVYLHVWEDNDAETFNILVNGKVAQANYNSGAAGHWDRLGPYPATVTNGALTVSINGGTANLSGLEIWTAGGAALAPAPTTPAPTTSTGGVSFYRAISLNGSATTIDGNPWEGSSTPDYSANGSRFSLQSQALTPSADASRAAMLRACQYSNSLDFRMTAVPNGNYLVSAYVWEDNFTETYSLALNGQTVASNLQTGAAGAWAKVGPYPVTVSNGTIQLTSSGGTVNLSGVEVWQQNTGASLASTVSTSAVAARSTTAPVSLFPNPLSSGQSRVQVEATVAEAEQVVVQVLTHMGTLLRQATLNFPAGLSSQLLEVGDLAPGTYVVRFASGSLLGKTIGLLKRE